MSSPIDVSAEEQDEQEGQWIQKRFARNRFDAYCFAWRPATWGPSGFAYRYPSVVKYQNDMCDPDKAMQQYMDEDDDEDDFSGLDEGFKRRIEAVIEVAMEMGEKEFMAAGNAAARHAWDRDGNGAKITTEDMQWGLQHGDQELVDRIQRKMEENARKALARKETASSSV